MGEYGFLIICLILGGIASAVVLLNYIKRNLK